MLDYALCRCTVWVQLLENRDDDGETGAGDKMLYLIQKMNVEDIVVVVRHVN